MADLKNYKLRDGCWNCLHVFLNVEQDEPFHWYCNITDDRPRRGVCDYKTHKECHFHDEQGKYLSDDEVMQRSKKWYLWIEDKEVKSYGICDDWEKSICKKE